MLDLGKIKNAFTASRKAAAALGDNLEDIRQRIADLHEQRAGIEYHAPELAIALKRVDAFADHLRRPLEDFYLGHFAGAGRFVMPDILPQVTGRIALAGCADLIADALKARLRAQYANSDGISEKDREAKLAEIGEDLLALEMLEEASIRHAERAGFDILRRHNANPLAVLAADQVLPQ